MTSHEIRTSFNAFTALRKLGLCEPGQERVQYPIHSIVTGEKCGGARTSIFLNLDFAFPSTLDMVRIDIRNFVQLSSRFQNPQKQLYDFCSPTYVV
jgi:hypothetical protein